MMEKQGIPSYSVCGFPKIIWAAAVRNRMLDLIAFWSDPARLPASSGIWTSAVEEAINRVPRDFFFSGKAMGNK